MFKEYEEAWNKTMALGNENMKVTEKPQKI